MYSMYYVQQYGADFSEILLVKQPIPDKIAASIRLWATVQGLEFHILENSTLYVSRKKPGVLQSKDIGFSHVLVKKTNDNSLLDFRVESNIYLDRLKEALDGDAVAWITNYLNQHNPIEDHAEFLSTLARLEAELRQKQDEEEREKALEQQRREKEEEQKHAEAMHMAAVEFLKGDDIGGNTFCDLLQFHDLWSGIHPKTKHFMRKRLVSINNIGSYRYHAYTSLRGGNRSPGSKKLTDIARTLNRLLEEAPTPETLTDAFSGVQKAA